MILQQKPSMMFARLTADKVAAEFASVTSRVVD
jgi:hypothetical protein